MKILHMPINDALKASLDRYAKQEGVHKKKIVELALADYLKKRIKPVL